MRCGRLEPDELALVVAVDSMSVVDDPVVDFLTNGAVGSGRVLAVNGEELFDISEPVARIVLMAPQADLRRAVESKYPSARLTIERNLHGDPMILIYDLANNGE